MVMTLAKKKNALHVELYKNKQTKQKVSTLKEKGLYTLVFLIIGLNLFLCLPGLRSNFQFTPEILSKCIIGKKGGKRKKRGATQNHQYINKFRWWSIVIVFCFFRGHHTLSTRFDQDSHSNSKNS